MTIRIKIDLKSTNLNRVGLTDAQVTRINKKAVNDYVRIVDKYIPRKIAVTNNLGIVSFKKVRAVRSLAKARGRGKLLGKFWIGENDVLARFKKGAWRSNKSGAGKGDFFQKGAFLATFKSGHKGIFKRTANKTRTGNAELESVRVPLMGYAQIVNEGMAKAQNSVTASFRRDIKLELGK